MRKRLLDLAPHAIEFAARIGVNRAAHVGRPLNRRARGGLILLRSLGDPLRMIGISVGGKRGEQIRRLREANILDACGQFAENLNGVFRGLGHVRVGLVKKWLAGDSQTPSGCSRSEGS